MREPLNEAQVIVAEMNGIDYVTLYNRYYVREWTSFDATTKPKEKRRRVDKYPEYWKNVAKKNGVYHLYHDRRRRGDSNEEAATRPIGGWAQ